MTLLRHISKPVELGVQLYIDYGILQRLERDYQGDTGRQMIAVIDFWLNNSTDCSWRALAKAVEKLGGHDQLVTELNLKEKGSLTPKVLKSTETGKSPPI